MAKQNGEAKAKQGQAHPAESSSEQSEQGQARDPGQEGSSGSKGKEQQGSEKKEQGKGGGKSKQGGGDQKEQQKPSRVEWVVATACALLVLSAVGYLFYRALSGPELPPMITVRTERVLPMGGGGYLVEIKAVNEGSGTAANLMVEGTLMRDTAVIEKSTATVQFVPAETEREGGLFFTKDPRLYRLEVRPTGFDRP